MIDLNQGEQESRFRPNFNPRIFNKFPYIQITTDVGKSMESNAGFKVLLSHNRA
jgi:hypothetical protein